MLPHLVSEMLQQFVPLSDISQGSVATHLRCVGIFGIIANFLLILTMKQFRKSVNIDKITAYKNCAKIYGPPYNYKLYFGSSKLSILLHIYC